MTQDKRVRWSQSQIESFSEDVSYYELTEQQVSALLNAIGVIGWATRWVDTEPSFYLEFGTSLEDKLMSPIDICTLIVNCIDNNQSVKDALQNNREENGYTPSDPTKSERDPTKPIPSNTNVINDDTKCNNDQLFGQATELVDYMHAIIEDTMEFLEYAATQIEFTQDVTGVIPLFGKATELVTGFAEWMFNNMANGYQAGYTQTLRDEMRCDLYCLMQEDCQLTFDELADYFAGKASITITGQSIEQIAAQLINILDGTTIVYAMHGVLAGILQLGGNWAGINSVTSLQTALALGANNPDGDWAILCDDCTPPPVPCEFPMFVLDRDVQAVEPCVTIVDGSYGLLTNPSWIEGYTGYYLTRTGSGQFGARCIVDLPEVRDSVNVTFSMAFVFGSPQTVNHQWLVRVVDGSGVPISSDFMTQESLLTNQSYTRTIPVSYVGMARLQITALVTNAGGTMSMATYNIQIN